MSDLTDLDALLDEERAALIAGRLDSLARLADRKAELVETISADDPDQLQTLRDKAERNHQLLAAAQAGIRAAHRRIQDISACHGAQPAGFGYDAKGRPAAIPGPAALERRS